MQSIFLLFHITYIFEVFVRLLASYVLYDGFVIAGPWAKPGIVLYLTLGDKIRGADPVCQLVGVALYSFSGRLLLNQDNVYD